MSLKKRIAAIVTTFVVGVGGALAVATPAQAGMGDCPAGYLCLWEHIDYTSPMYLVSPSTTCKSLGTAINNKTSSLMNRSSRKVRVWDASNCSGSYIEFYTNTADWNLHYWAQGTSWGDRISSYRWV